MRPTVLSNANANASAGVGGGGGNSNTNGIQIPIHHDYGNGGNGGPQSTGGYYADANTGSYGSPRGGQQQQQQPSPQQQSYAHQQAPQPGQQPQQQQHPHQQMPQHFQGFGFEPDMDMDMDMDMFPRSRLGRMHDPFGSFNNTHFGFPQFNSLGRRRAADHMGRDDDFFNRLPSEFRQYIPDGFGHRRAGESATLPRQHSAQHTQQVPVQSGGGGVGGGAPAYYQSYAPASPPNGVPQSPSKKLCDAAIQTEDPAMRTGGDEVDHAAPQLHGDNLKQHGLRNTVDMGVKSALESEQGARAHSAPPQEQQQVPVNGKRQTPPPQAGHTQFGTQTSPHVQAGVNAGQQPQFHKVYYPPQQQPHPQQRQQTPPPPQTPGGSYVRTIPIFVEGRSEPIINAHKEIPNQNSAPGQAQASASASARAYVPPQQQQSQQHHQPQSHQQQQQHRPTPLNTQQPQQQGEGTAAAAGMPPQTPHTLDSISKIQDIQRDVLDLMGKVEKFTGTRQDKEYVYLDEMLTRNLLKLDTIDTNGKDSIRLARKEAIKCIQASINVLEAKANENTKAAQQAAEGGEAMPEQSAAEQPVQTENAATRKSASKEKVGATAADATETPAVGSEPEPADAKQIQAPIPLPPPEGMQVEETAAVSEAKSAESKESAAETVAETSNKQEAEAGAPTSEGSAKAETESSK
ncbi:BAG domain-containing protein Samui isoform X2 [Ceratitis capitata]|uniref:BAG domain-containing protein Samui isoform X2 n=1 Tax=Ceratitis capitata TaxID=7213 RepID=UPI00061883C0|nr:BAG domain-containing protein Samui isoform X2 [Ceratitis capitata]